MSFQPHLFLTLCPRKLSWISFCKQMEDILLSSIYLYMMFLQPGRNNRKGKQFETHFFFLTWISSGQSQLHPSTITIFSVYPLFLRLTALSLNFHYYKSASIPEQEITYHLSHRGTDDIIPFFFFCKVQIYFKKTYFFLKDFCL